MDILDSFKEKYEDEIQAACAAAGIRKSDISEWNEIGLALMQRGNFSDTERMYRWAEQRCYQVEKENGVVLHKGTEYCNLAIALLELRRFNEAMTYLERAEAEDIRNGQISHAGENIIERKILREALVELDARISWSLYPNCPMQVSFPNDIVSLWEHIDRSKKLRLAAMLRQLDDLKTDTTSERRIRFNALSEVSLLTEDTLKILFGGHNNLVVLLGKGVHDATQCKLESYITKGLSFTVDNIDIEIDRVVATLNKGTTVHELMNVTTFVTYAVRNYTHHNADVSVKICSHEDFNDVFNLLLLTLVRVKCPPLVIRPTIALRLLKPFPHGATPARPSAEELKDYLIEGINTFLPTHQPSDIRVSARDGERIFQVEFTSRVCDQALIEVLEGINEELGSFMDIKYTITDHEGDLHQWER